MLNANDKSTRHSWPLPFMTCSVTIEIKRINKETTKASFVPFTGDHDNMILKDQDQNLLNLH